jgi:hypothetical protein
MSSTVKLIGRQEVGPAARYCLLKNAAWFGQAQEDTVYREDEFGAHHMTTTCVLQSELKKTCC